MPIKTSLLVCSLLCWSGPAPAQGPAPERADGKYLTYSPASGMFSCQIPASGWYPFDEEDAQGPVVHILGPENPAGDYRAGLSIRWLDPSQSGYVEPKKAVDILRRPDKTTARSATSVRPLRVANLLARVFEIQETRTLPLDRLPAGSEVLHHYVAVIPNGSGYYMIRLSSSRDTYLDLRDEFAHFLKTFEPIGR
ncbi:MAG: hypothetical protein WC881_00110 [Elusimicrobiota bacterium]